MGRTQKILLAAILIGLVLLIIIFWGSLFSGILAFCLIMTMPTYLYNRFSNAERETDFTEDNNG